MPRTVESRIAAHHAAHQRQNEGRPIWDRVIRLGALFHDPDLTFTDRRDAIVARLRKSGWTDQNHGVADLVHDLAIATDQPEFNDIWDEIHDEADIDRVFIDTVSR